jgi:CheY-like chemotaxis protein
MNKKKKILVADDESIVRTLIRKILKNDYIVLEAQNGQEAVDMARRYFPDVILLDMLMPKKDGLTACYEIKADETINTIPIILLTAADAMGNKSLAKDVWGANEYLTKPFNTGELLVTIQQLMSSSGSCTEQLHSYSKFVKQG